ncbi:unnamed protein product [Hymenolepis diminuta]|uniref:Uncharacterized protein n=1 Tax=Hymenolepis diminuta TaxID=6216 RepID=A0A564YB38_HYMDI|nr:unnamed protein product [Hymenolepis diminuta]
MSLDKMKALRFHLWSNVDFVELIDCIAGAINVLVPTDDIQLVNDELYVRDKIKVKSVRCSYNSRNIEIWYFDETADLAREIYNLVFERVRSIINVYPQ